MLGARAGAPSSAAARPGDWALLCLHRLRGLAPFNSRSREVSCGGRGYLPILLCVRLASAAFTASPGES